MISKQSLLPLLFLSACAGSPVDPQSVADRPSAAAMVNCAAAAAYSAAHEGASFLVLRNGATVCEDYPNGGAVDQAHVLASGTKSFTGLIAAAATQDGFLRLDELVSDTLPEWKSEPRKARVTIRQLLSLSSGLDPSETGAPPSYSVAIALPMKYEPNTKFEYGPAAFQVFGAVMKRKLAVRGQSADAQAYLQRRILDPIGVKPARWARTVEGDPTMPSGAALTARDWAKVGEFVRAGGRVDGKPLVDPGVFAELFKSCATNPGYGISWWLPAEKGLIASQGEVSNDSFDGLPQDTRMAAGAGFQRLYVIPSLGLTIVRQAEKAPRAERQAANQAARAAGQTLNKWSDAAFLRAALSEQIQHAQ